MDFLLRLAQVHESFRLAEIETAATIAGIQIEIISYSPDSPFCVLRFVGALDNLAAARALVSRLVLAKAIYELWGVGSSYPELHADCKTRSRPDCHRYEHSAFRFSFDTFCGKRSSAQQREIINSFRYLGFQGPISMREPDVEFVVFEEWDLMDSIDHRPSLKCTSETKKETSASASTSNGPRRLFFGRTAAFSPRHLIEKHDLKKRPYISTTSMDAELALVTANLALAGPGKLFLDPFAGTGGFLIAAAEFGAFTFGMDIDGRSFRGHGRGLESGVGANFKTYNLESKFGDCITSDLTNSPLRSGVFGSIGCGRWIDGIICDPPYGVREGLRVLGTRNSKVANGKTGIHLIDGTPAHKLEGYIAPKRPYSFSLMLDDIMDFAASTLVDDGRLAFWMPTANEDDEEIQVPKNKYLELKHCPVQRFNKWSRRVLVYRRKAETEIRDSTGDDRISTLRNSQRSTADDLNAFRKRYFQGFA